MFVFKIRNASRILVVYDIVIWLLQGVLALCGMPDSEGKPVLLCSCNDNSVRFYDLPSWVFCNQYGLYFYFPFLIQIGTLQPISCMHSCFPNCFLLCYYGLGLLRGVKFLPNKRFEPFSWALAVCFSLVMGLVKWECGNGVTGRLQLDDQCNIISAIMSFDSSLFHFLLFCFIFGVHSDISLPGKLLVENADFGLLVVGASNPLSLSVCHSFIHKAHPFSKGNCKFVTIPTLHIAKVFQS